jgi:serine/threonine-protein kinase
MIVNPFSKTVPDLSGMTLDEAAEAAKKAGYTISDEIEYSLSDSVPENYVVEQMPEAGAEAPKSEPISLVISLGTSGGGIPVPDVVNMDIDEASRIIEEETLQYKIVLEPSDDVEYGYIIRQIPAAGTHINSGDYVTLHMSSGPDSEGESENRVTVPNIIGMYRDNAESTLGMNGLAIGTVSKKPSDNPEGTIIMQSPAAGASVRENTTVTIVVSSGDSGSTLGSDYSETAPVAQENTQAVQSTPSSTVSGGTETTQAGGGNTASEPEANESTGGSSGSTMYTVKIPDAANDTVNVEIVVDGQVVHNALHQKTEGAVTVEISGTGSVSVQAYIDGAKVSDKTVTF